MKHTHRNKEAAALALAAALWLTGSGSALAATIINDSTTINSTDANEYYELGADNIEVTVAEGAETGNIHSDGTGNTIIIKGSVKELFGGRSGTNILVDASGYVTREAYGGYSNTAADIQNNTFTLNGGYADKLISGGYSLSNAVMGNKVIISGGTANRDVYGGYTWSTQNASQNTVTLESGTVGKVIYGGYSQFGVASGNTVTISGGKVNGYEGVAVYGGFTGTADSEYNSSSDNNTVNISGGTVSGAVYGGYSKNKSENNTVNISGGTVTGNIYGGRTDGNNSSSGNTVNITGEANLGPNIMIAGGMPGTNNGIANNNTVNILKAISIGTLYGGFSRDGSGNTLNLAAKGVTLSNELDYFQNLNFYLPTDMTTSDIMLTVGTANVDGAKVGVLAQGKLQNLTTGDKVTLLHATNLNGTVSQNLSVTAPASIATVNTYDFSVTSDANNIYATITKDSSSSGDSSNSGGNGGNGSSAVREAQANTKSVTETKAATTTFINAGSDMLASQGFTQAAKAVAAERTSNAGAPVSMFTPFSSFGGSSLRAESGSHVDTKSFGMTLGFVKEFQNRHGTLLFGPLAEYGGGSYDSYLDNGVHGDGGSRYWGLGVLARQVNHDGLYYEGSLRAGRVTSDYKGSFNLQTVTYDSKSTYWAAHLGLGKILDIGHSNTLDSYLKYFYSHQGGDNVTMHTTAGANEDWRFDGVDSHRLRLGARLTHKVNEQNSFYGGLAYQYEFGGEARAHYNGGSTPSPSVKGSSGMLELGWEIKPGGPMTLDLGVSGWVGKQRGISVQLGAMWKF